jgi:hypothetical protein
MRELPPLGNPAVTAASRIIGERHRQELPAAVDQQKTTVGRPVVEENEPSLNLLMTDRHPAVRPDLRDR